MKGIDEIYIDDLMQCVLVTEEVHATCDSALGGTIVTWYEGTGLVVAPASTEITANKADAIQYCTSMTEGGFSDWRLPTLAEAQSLQYVTTCAELVNLYYGTSDVNPAAPSTTWTTHNPVSNGTTYSNYMTTVKVRAVRTG